eukprot:jgi/Tetstr1/425954/TSEL_016304.t1
MPLSTPSTPSTVSTDCPTCTTVEILGYTKGHIIKRFKELAATATGFAYDIIPGAPTDNVMRKQIQKAAGIRKSDWPLSKKWLERKTKVIQL